MIDSRQDEGRSTTGEVTRVTATIVGSGDKYDPRIAVPFVNRSVSEETRRAYRRVVREFFRYVGERHPATIMPHDVQRWRDHLARENKRAATIAFKLSVVRSLFDYLVAGDYVRRNPAATKLVPPPAAPETLRGRALTPKEVGYLLAGPDRSTPEGKRDYALLLLMLKTSLRVSEACGLRRSQIETGRGRWTIRFVTKGGRERLLPLPDDVKRAIDDYMDADGVRRMSCKSGGTEAYIFQPHVNFRTLRYDKPLSATMAWHIVRRWAEFGGIGKLSPHDLRRTAITRALDQGLTYRQVQMMTGHKDPKTVMRYDYGRENLDQNAINFLDYTE